MDIGFRFPGIGDLARDSGVAATNFERIARAAADLSKATRDQPTGPATRLSVARANLSARVQAGASDESVADAQIAVARAEKAFASARKMVEGSSTSEKLLDVLSSSRFGVGPGGRLNLMPLLGKTASALGGPVAAALGLGTEAAGPAATALGLGAGAEVAGPVGLALAAGLGLAVKGLHEFTQALGEGVNNIRELTTAASTSGGTIGQASLLRQMGLDASAGVGLRERMASDPFAMVAGQRLGVPAQLPLPFGSQNTAQLQIRIIEGLRGITNAEEQLRLARMLGQEQLVEVARTSNLVFAQMKADAAATQRIMGGSDTQLAARDLAAGTQRVTSNWQLLEAAFAKPFIPLAAASTNLLGTVLSDVAETVNMVLLPLSSFAETLHRLVGMLGGGGAMDEHTKAMQEHTEALREGTFGGGARAGKAVPADLRGDMLSRELERGAIRMGAF